jgi:hypothetical protein
VTPAGSMRRALRGVAWLPALCLAQNSSVPSESDNAVGNGSNASAAPAQLACTLGRVAQGYTVENPGASTVAGLGLVGCAAGFRRVNATPPAVLCEGGAFSLSGCVDACAGVLCQHSGLCVVGAANTSWAHTGICRCVPGYAGDACELYEQPPSDPVR